MTTKPRLSRSTVALALVFLVGARASAERTARGPEGTIAAGGEAILLISPRTGETRRVSAPDRVLSFDLSPDGRRIAVAGFTGIWVMNRDGSRPRRIFDGRGLKPQAGHVVWSPDGRRMAFIRGGVLFTISADGKSVRRVVGNAETPDWWPDGKQIVFVRNPDRSSRNGTISAIRPDGSGLRQIVGRGRWYRPRISPDGAKVAFYRNGIRGAYIASTRGGAPRLFVRNGSQPEWAPDGRHLAFTREARCAEIVCTSRVFIVAASGGKARPYGPKLAEMILFSWSRV